MPNIFIRCVIYVDERDIFEEIFKVHNSSPHQDLSNGLALNEIIALARFASRPLHLFCTSAALNVRHMHKLMRKHGKNIGTALRLTLAQRLAIPTPISKLGVEIL